MERVEINNSNEGLHFSYECKTCGAKWTELIQPLNRRYCNRVIKRNPNPIKCSGKLISLK